ncbi:hypothetical protein [Endozoicomonas sp.]|uniref:hypothetical protein n=1 Tax=Endozoicomonas sp. TaxID=1892382 RepID=UPI003AF80219
MTIKRSEPYIMDNTPASLVGQDESEVMAEQILRQWISAWKITDKEERLAACCRCKIDTMRWYQRLQQQSLEEFE